MKAADSRQLASVVSPLLKIVCGILYISFFVDVASLIYPSRLLDRQWQLNFATQVVDRGVVPLVGLALLLTALWMDSAAGNLFRQRLWKNLGLAAFILSSLLGLVFLLLIPFHLNNVNFVSGETLKRIGQEATTAESQLEAQIQQQQNQISTILGDSRRLDELDKAIKSGQVQGDQLAQLQQLQQQLQQFRQDPQALKKQVEEARKRDLTRIRERKLQLEKQAQSDAGRSALRTSISSFLLALGYVSVGWLGLRGTESGDSKK
ncbi:MAG: HpsJ family protein [Leptolyngbyaceae cyanobacterium bins.59]|nr:HpsJ family protein [Leptolyngbyaceae cyanobacterium bins.59]